MSLINEILKTKYEVVCCENIGYSVCQALLDYEDCNIFIVECSSFQLEASKVCFDISVLLNVNPSHLDNHNSFDNYIEAKSNICRYLNNNSIFIYNGDDDICKSVSNITLANKYYFSYCYGDCYIKSNKLYFKSIYIIDVDDFSYGFIHNNLEGALKDSLAKRVDEIILFSPMFASYNQFKNYEQRGKLFNELCQKLL